jgi:hypothetical protein
VADFPHLGDQVRPLQHGFRAVAAGHHQLDRLRARVEKREQLIDGDQPEVDGDAGFVQHDHVIVSGDHGDLCPIQCFRR